MYSEPHNNIVVSMLGHEMKVTSCVTEFKEDFGNIQTLMVRKTSTHLIFQLTNNGGIHQIAKITNFTEVLTQPFTALPTTQKKSGHFSV